MTVAYDSHRSAPAGLHASACLEDKYEILKDIGDGSFGSVALGRTRSAGAHVVRRGTLVSALNEQIVQCLHAARLPSRP